MQIYGRGGGEYREWQGDSQRKGVWRHGQACSVVYKIYACSLLLPFHIFIMSAKLKPSGHIGNGLNTKLRKPQVCLTSGNIIKLI